MSRSRNALMFGMSFPILAGCSGGATGEEQVTAAPSALTAAEVVTGFESLAAWSVISGTATLALSTDHAGGSRSLSVGNVQNAVTIRSDLTSAPATLDPKIGLSIKPPAGHDQAPWKGEVQLAISSPSRGLYSRFVGQVSLAGLKEGTFGAVSFDVPAPVLSAFEKAGANDVQYLLQLMVPLSAAYLIDDLRLGPQPAMIAPTPTAYVGGRDIALVWPPMPWSRTTARYQVVRDDQFVFARPGNLNSAFPNTYVDEDVNPGETHTYRVFAVDSDGNYSTASAPVAVTFPLDAAPVPNITIDHSKFTPDIADQANKIAGLEAGKRFLETWYPKAVQLLARPAYEPSAELVIQGELDCGGGWVFPQAEVPKSEFTVHICEGNAWDMGLYAHEATHVTQSYRTDRMPGLGESVASWIGELSKGNPSKNSPTPLMSYYDDYEWGAYFYNWIARVYNKPNFVRDLNQAALLGQFGENWFSNYTGRTLGQLYGEMLGTGFTSPGSLKNAANLYAFPQNSNLTVGSNLHLLHSTPTNSARFFQGQLRNGTGLLRWEKTACFGVNDQNQVVIRKCEDLPSLQWTYDKGRFKHVATDRCMQAQGGSNLDGTLVVTESCSDTSLAQRWNPLPN